MQEEIRIEGEGPERPEGQELTDDVKLVGVVDAAIFVLHHAGVVPLV